jgi:hypothetical protein
MAQTPAHRDRDHLGRRPETRERRPGNWCRTPACAEASPTHPARSTAPFFECLDPAGLPKPTGDGDALGTRVADLAPRSTAGQRAVYVPERRTFHFPLTVWPIAVTGSHRRDGIARYGPTRHHDRKQCLDCPQST